MSYMINTLKFSFSLLFLWIAFRVVSFQTVVPIIMHADKTFILFAFILQLASTILASYRWSLIMGALHFHQTFLFYLG
ncbi:hypothetical protein, partial [Sulfuricurvum sp.]|uniref:hypothetical protein n=1 Tax=Sulfuricurvum sp. TaxID=2025608 RepID=UPI002D59C83D